MTACRPNKRARPMEVYSTYGDYYTRKHGVTDMHPQQPLMKARGFALHTSGVNFLLPPHQGSRRREEKRCQQLQAIAHAIKEADRAAAEAARAEADAAAGTCPLIV